MANACIAIRVNGFVPCLLCGRRISRRPADEPRDVGLQVTRFVRAQQRGVGLVLELALPEGEALALASAVRPERRLVQLLQPAHTLARNFLRI